jgi:hypothetical protein
MRTFALLSLCISAHAAPGSKIRFQSAAGPDVLISYDGATLNVPQHCRAETCGKNSANIATLQSATLAADAALRADTASEATARQAADGAEAAARTSAVNGLQDSLDSALLAIKAQAELIKALTSQVTTLQGVDASTATKIEQLSRDSTAADAALDARINQAKAQRAALEAKHDAATLRIDAAAAADAAALATETTPRTPPTNPASHLRRPAAMPLRPSTQPTKRRPLRRSRRWRPSPPTRMPPTTPSSTPPRPSAPP